MPPFAPIPRAVSPLRPDDQEIASAVSCYLEVSRSPLRRDEPVWFDIAEQAEWERVCSAVGRPEMGIAPGSAGGPAGA